MRSHSQVVNDQFGTTAAAYLTSAVHAQGEDLQMLAGIAAGLAANGNGNGNGVGARVLDLGCGGGHAAFAVAPVVHQVVAYDLSPQMLEVVAGAARERGLGNVQVQQGSAAELPFADASFDMVCTRFSAHHWRGLPRALEQAMRVLKPGGRLVVIDTAAPGDVLADTYVQAIELLRDTSHVRNVSRGSWRKLLGRAGFAVTGDQVWKLRLEFASWVARMRTPAANVVAIKALWDSAPAEVRDYFRLEQDYSFGIDVVMLEALKLS